MDVTKIFNEEGGYMLLFLASLFLVSIVNVNANWPIVSTPHVRNQYDIAVVFVYALSYEWVREIGHTGAASTSSLVFMSSIDLFSLLCIATFHQYHLRALWALINLLRWLWFCSEEQFAVVHEDSPWEIVSLQK